MSQQADVEEIIIRFYQDNNRLPRRMIIRLFDELMSTLGWSEDDIIGMKERFEERI